MEKAAITVKIAVGPVCALPGRLRICKILGGDSRSDFAQARFRAIEQGLPVVRSANTGISGIIDPYGRVLHKLDLLEEGYISAHLPQKTDPTFYSKNGDLLYGIFVLILLSVGLIYRHP